MNCHHPLGTLNSPIKTEFLNCLLTTYWVPVLHSGNQANNFCLLKYLPLNYTMEWGGSTDS